MPAIDSRTGSLTLRIVYDGPPMAGKTTSVGALAERVRGTRGLTTPATLDGRTLYFDWLEFVGGDFGSKEIRVQVTSVPGQAELRHRRHYLLGQADAVVFVADSRRGHLEGAVHLFAELVSVTQAQIPAVGVVVQANKRDEPDALDLLSVRRTLNCGTRVTFIDSIATNGDGVREAFAMAVRVALDRAQVMFDQGTLHVGALEVESADDLLAHMTSLDSKRLDAVAAKTGAARQGERAHQELERLGLDVSHGAPVEVQDTESPFTPDACLPSGHIWPPLEGRAIVHEASQEGIVPIRTASGDWWASCGGWRFHSAADALYDDVVIARGSLIGWARDHVRCAGVLSPDRALMLAGAGPSRFRLWQLVRVLPSLREQLLADELTPVELAERLCEVGQCLLDARAAIESLGIGLKCSLWTIGRTEEARPAFVGLMPLMESATLTEPTGRTLLRREFLPILPAIARNMQLDELAAHIIEDGAPDVSGELVELLRATRLARV